jgi:hypothetical protein
MIFFLSLLAILFSIIIFKTFKRSNDDKLRKEYMEAKKNAQSHPSVIAFNKDKIRLIEKQKLYKRWSENAILKEEAIRLDSWKNSLDNSTISDPSSELGKIDLELRSESLKGEQSDPEKIAQLLKERYNIINVDKKIISKKKRTAISTSIKDQVWKRDGGKCVECNSKENLEFDHIIPFSKGGANTYRNLQLLCVTCNQMKSDKIG